MTSVTATIEPDAPAPEAPTPPSGLGSRLIWEVRDALTLTGRNLRHIRRVPEKLLGVTVMPLMFVLLFAYVFGSAIEIPGGGDYREFLMAGIFVQTVIFTSMSTATGVTEDMRKGLMDRFRSLPMSRAAVLSGRTVADLVETMLGIAIMVGAGLLMGWTIRTSFGEALLGFALLLLVAFTMIWVGALLGLLVRTTEAVTGLGMVVLFPLTFVANAFVPTAGMPDWLRTIADWNPVSAAVAACRELFGNPAGPPSDAWPLQNALLWSIVFWTAILVVTAPLAVRRYRTAIAR